jgi:hypothetical protein
MLSARGFELVGGCVADQFHRVCCYGIRGHSLGVRCTIENASREQDQAETASNIATLISHLRFYSNISSSSLTGIRSFNPSRFSEPV